MHNNSEFRNRLLSVQETADYLGVSTQTIYKMSSQRRLPKTKIGGRLRFDLQQLNVWIREHTLMPISTTVQLT